MSYYFSKTINGTLESAKEKVTASLMEEGFGVLTEIDMKATLKKKLDVDLKPYLILGACNPGFAHQALQAEQNIGTMLPCNVILKENEPGKIEVAAVDPVASMQAIENKKLAHLATEVRSKLQKVIEKL
ncbi:MAG: DUF302 domain-containing protein [Bacteroidetes bacterium]|jgi:uncharacterized protein (DUF302 family)|nr:DUF302 domain-containing protein [Bacteroidota bacterium]